MLISLSVLKQKNPKPQISPSLFSPLNPSPPIRAARHLSLVALVSTGYPLTIFNRTPSKAHPFLSRRACLADSPAALVRSFDVVFLIVGYPFDIRHVILDLSSGVLSTAFPGSVIVDLTTSDPSLAREIASSVSSSGCHSVDAPISGGDCGARNAALSIFAGGDQTLIQTLVPLFYLMGKVDYMGGPGSGQQAKLGNQIAIASTMVDLVEGMVYAHKAELDVSQWMAAISTRAAGSKILVLYGKRIMERDMEQGFYVRHFIKDLGICLKECERMGLALAQQLYVSLVAHEEGEIGTQALVLAIERLSNVCLKKEESG